VRTARETEEEEVEGIVETVPRKEWRYVTHPELEGPASSRGANGGSARR